jgi:hypothetical protein
MKAKVMQEGDTALQNFERTMKSVFATPKAPKALARQAKTKRARKAKSG